jgi:ESCRT-II complex subunit VPS25
MVESLGNEAMARRGPNCRVLYQCHTGNAEALDAERQTFRIYWRSVDAWAALIYQYVKEQGAYDVILTVYELHAGDDTAGQEFHGMDLPTMLRALDALEAQGRCTVFKSADTEGTGVKFYAA